MEKATAESNLQYILDNYKNEELVRDFVRKNPIGEFEFENIEYKIVADVFYHSCKNAQKYFEEWCKLADTDCKILDLICYYVNSWWIKDFNFNKTISKIDLATFYDLVATYASYDMKLDSVPDEIADNLIRWYQPFVNTGILHLECVKHKQFKFYKKIPYDFNPLSCILDEETFPSYEQDNEDNDYNYDTIKEKLKEQQHYFNIYQDNFEKFMEQIKEEDVPMFIEFCKTIDDRSFKNLIEEIPLSLFLRIKDILLLRQTVISKLIDHFIGYTDNETIKPEIIIAIKNMFPQYTAVINHRIALSRNKEFIKAIFPDFSKKTLDEIMDNLEKSMMKN